VSLLPDEPTKGTNPEHVILNLARTQPVIQRHEIDAAMQQVGVETCYESALQRCEANGDVEIEGAGVWRSRIWRG
jgi:hypothetical protein